MDPKIALLILTGHFLHTRLPYKQQQVFRITCEMEGPHAWSSMPTLFWNGKVWHLTDRMTIFAESKCEWSELPTSVIEALPDIMVQQFLEASRTTGR